MGENKEMNFMNKSDYNNLASTANQLMRAPYKFKGGKSSNANKFLQEFNEFAEAMGWNAFQKKISFKLSLEGEASVWAESLESDLTVDELQRRFTKRFVPLNIVTLCINELVEAKREREESLMSFLDRLKSIAGKGMLPHDVLVAMALKALPMDFTNRLVVAPGGVTWESLYESCSVWEATGLESKENNFQCFSNSSRSGYITKRKENMGEIKSKKGFNFKCYFCDKMGHRIKDCFELQEMKNQKVKRSFSIKKMSEFEEENQIDKNKFNGCYLLENLKIIENFNIKIKINGIFMTAIYDTGSDLSLLDSDIIKNLELIKTNKKIIAANSSFLDILGETDYINLSILNLNKSFRANL